MYTKEDLIVLQKDIDLAVERVGRDGAYYRTLLLMVKKATPIIFTINGKKTLDLKELLIYHPKLTVQRPRYSFVTARTSFITPKEMTQIIIVHNELRIQRWDTLYPMVTGLLDLTRLIDASVVKSTKHRAFLVSSLAVITCIKNERYSMFTPVRLMLLRVRDTLMFWKK